MMRKKITLANSIYLQLLLAFVLVVLVPTLIISATSVWSSYQISQQRTLDQLNSIAALKSAEIDMWIRELDTGLEMLLGEYEMTESALPLLQGQFSPAEARQAHDLIQKNMNLMAVKSQVFNHTILLDARGRVIVASDPAQEGLDLSDKNYYQQGLQKHFITPPFYAAPQDQRLMIVASHPIIVAGQGAVGMIAGYSDLSVLDRIMEAPAGLGQTGESYLVGPDYTPITQLRFQLGDLVTQVKSEGIRSALETRVYGSGLYPDYHDTPVVGVHTWLPTLQVALVVEVTQAEAFNSALTTLGVNLGVALGAMLLTVLVAFLITRSIATPLMSLAVAATHIASGDLNRVVEVKRQDEIGKLAQAFNFMTGQLRTLIEELKAELAERQRAEEQLRYQTTLLENVNDAIVASDAHHRITNWNAAAELLYGWKAQEVLGQDGLAVLQTAWLSEDAQEMNRVIAETGRWRGEALQSLKNGKRIAVEISSIELRDEGGRVTGYVSVNRDITERKRAEEEIRQFNLELEQRVRDRTVQLEATNKELEAFAYSVSHDLRAPLRALDGFSGILLSEYRDELDAPGQHYLTRIQEASRRMGQLIEDLLNLSRITRREMSRNRVNLTLLAQQITAELQKQDPPRQVTFEIAPNLIALADPNLMKIAMENLLNNAYKFTSLREHALIQVGIYEKAGERVFYVRDNGTGFDMAYVGKLFIPFQRLHGMQEFPGTGIGLVTVQRIISRHGGRLWPEAVVGQGATFYFTLGESDDYDL